MAKRAKRAAAASRTHRPRPSPATFQAVGAHEAASLLGIHWTVVYRLGERGKLTVQYHEGEAGRKVTFFDGRECEQNWCDYCEAISGNGTGKRPRSHTEDRETVIRCTLFAENL
jgi:hypothetical protein